MTTDSPDPDTNTARTVLLADILGYGGVLPFAALALASWVERFHAVAVHSLLVYAAVILSFIGAVHWGLALQQENARSAQRLMLWSVMPALFAWLVLLLTPVVALLAMVVGFVRLWFYERHHLLPLFPAWYARLRTRLTTAVCFCLIVAWFAIM